MNAHSQNYWLIDDSITTNHRNPISAKIIINDRCLRVKRATQGTHIAKGLSDVHFGLGQAGYSEEN